MAALLTRVATGTVGTTTVTGTIFDPDGYPLAGIEIRLYDGGPGDGSLVETTTTDDAGRYRFGRVLTDGTDSYRVEADDLTGNHVYACSARFVAEVGVAAAHDLTLLSAGIIRGKATAQHAVLVTADGRHTCGESTVSPRGTFQLGGLLPGTYTVTFRDPAGTPLGETLKIKVIAGSTTTLPGLSSRRASSRASRHG